VYGYVYTGALAGHVSRTGTSRTGVSRTCYTSRLARVEMSTPTSRTNRTGIIMIMV